MTTLQRLCPSTSRILSRAGGLSSFSCSSRSYSKRVVKENDIVLLKHRTNPSAPILSGKLRVGRKTTLSSNSNWKDSIENDQIIGKELRDVVTSRKGVNYRVLEPSLADYTDCSPRIVTPIYSQDANLIVSLLDLHPSPPRPNAIDNERLEIFEAGTGHGALTLHLAKAIHAANPPAPIPEPTSQTDDNNAQLEDLNNDKAWRAARRAVIHTLDINVAHSQHAKQVVKNFRNGLYFPNVDFHAGTIEEYLSGRQATSDEPFLDHAILDLPATQNYFDIVSKAMKPHGTLIGFCPSITQINACILLVKQQNLPFFLEKVIETGGSVGVGGREWDVRLVTPRALKNESRDKTDGTDVVEDAVADRKVSEVSNSGGEMVCRPKVGVRVFGGGFLGVWRKITSFS
ncbi:adenine-N(1)--methyltransferase [Rhexocercosporidium sp. MPI-PUGE-AT-0058]|nr:adenine-N(1)--methyltransferase [Rhexocercosporidium sp. MPI-PUGE-AT-0058]